jgi:spondin N
MKIRKLTLSVFILAAIPGAQFSAVSLAHSKRANGVKFIARIENISNKDGQTAKDGTRWPFALSPGLWVMHESEVRLFKTGVSASHNGMEAQAEDGNPVELVKYLDLHHNGMLHGVFNTPVGASGPGPIGPGGAYEFSFTATRDMRLSFVMMFGQSNDWFYAPDNRGIDLFNDGKPLSGDITSKLILWDAGTEINQEPGVGPDQAPRQKAPNTGENERGAVHKAKESSFYNKTAELLRVTITPEDSL